MCAVKKINDYKNRLLLSTALTAAVLFSGVAPAVADICSGQNCTIDRKVLISELGGRFSDGIFDSRTYTLQSGTWTGTGGEVHVKGESSTGTITGTFENGIYQNGAGGISVGQESAYSPPKIIFDGGVLWDYSAYLSPFVNGYVVLSNGERAETDTVYGDISINGGDLRGRIDIRKGNPLETFTTNRSGSLEPVEYAVVSSGNINISGGKLHFTDDASQIKMYENNSGNINISGGDWDVDGNVLVQGVKSSGNTVDIIGGKFDVAAGKTLTLDGYSGSLSNKTSTLSFQGEGTLKLNFSEDFTVDSTIDWTDGTLYQAGGTLQIDAPVTVKAFKQDGNGRSLIISGVLSVTNDIMMNGNLSGKGELKLSETANATIGALKNFGTISIGRGTLTFILGNTTDDSSLSVLNGASGNVGEEVGTINVNARLIVETVNLGNSTLNLNQELSVQNLNFDNGKIVFRTDQKPLTLTNSTTIWNTSKIVTENSVVSGATAGMVTIKDGMTLTFADREGTTDAFSSGRLTLNVETGALAEFDSANVSFGTLKMTKGTATVKSGNVTVGSVVFGDRTANAGVLTINSGAKMTVDDLTATTGSTIAADGTLSVKDFTTKGSRSEWATLNGAGTVKVTGTGNFAGKIQNLANLEINGGAATFNNQTGGEDTISTMKVVNGTVSLKNGTLVLDSLVLDHGVIDLADENGTLALKQNPAESGSISGEGNSISGKGTLQLLNDTGMSFGGGTSGSVGYLGGLKIGTGTAKITADTSLGSVKFSSEQGGTLQIENGATLSLQDESGGCARSDNCRIETKTGNVVQGEGTLKLVDGNDSVFGGRVDLGTLNFGKNGGKITFNYAGESTIGTFTETNGHVWVNNGTLVVENAFGGAGTKVSGTGTLFLKEDGAFQTAAGQRLANLKIGAGTVKVHGAHFGNVAFDSDTAGTIDLNGDATVSGNITAAAGNTVKGTAKLILSGTGASGVFASDLTGLSGLTVKDGAVAYINASTKVGGSANGLNLMENSRLVVGNGATLTVSNSNLGSDNTSVITGDGTLNLAGNVTVKGVLNGLNNLSVSSGTATTEKTSTVKGFVTVKDGATLNFAGGSANSAAVEGTLNVKGDTALANVFFDADGGGILDIDAGRTLTLTNAVWVGENNTLSGTGTLYLAGGSTGTFRMNTAFAGHIKIGTGTAYIKTDASIGKIDFADGSGGVLDIETGKTLTVGSIATDGVNKISGGGTLNLTAAGSAFKAPIDHLGTLKVSGGTADFFNNIRIDTLAFNGGGSVGLNAGMTMNVNTMTQNGAIGTVFGEGSFVAGAGDVKLSTGGRNLAAATIGTGTLNFVGDSHIGSLRYSSVNGTINISDGKTVSVASDFSGVGKLTGAATAHLKLLGQAGATFENARQFQGTISADSGALRFRSDMDFASLNLNSAVAAFEREAYIDTVSVASGKTEFNQNANLGSLTISSAGSAVFNDTATLGALNAGSGTVLFKKNAALTGGSAGAGGVLNIGVNQLTLQNFEFQNNSTLAASISRDATDEQGNVNSAGYGRIQVGSGGALNIRDNVKLDLMIDYGLQTAETGSVFHLVDGDVTGRFNFENNRYSLVEETCSGSSGLCYRLTQSSTGGEVAEEQQGNGNQVGTAEAFLDGELFAYGTKIFEVAEHLDALSQRRGGSQAYLNALTAVAPDVTGAMSRQPIALQTKISNTLSARLNGLMGKMGSSSGTYKEIQKMYGRSGGSPYRSRFMRSDDYYRRAGYYDQDDQPVTRPRPAYRRRVEPGSREAVEAKTERKRWAKRKTAHSQSNDFGLWAQAFHNTADYLSANKPDGFSGDTDGVAFGADMQLFDVFAVGLGYASTSTTLDTLQRSTDVTGDSFFLYGMYKPSDWFVSAVANMTSMSYEEIKDLSGMTVSDNYDGSSFGASVMIGKDLKSWTPAVGVRYVTADRDAHKDEIGQDIAGISTDSLTLVAEARFNRDFARGDNSLWHGEFSGALTYDAKAAGEDAVVNLPNGSAYTVKGDDFDPFGIEAGASVSYLWGDHVDISAGYNLEWRPDYTSHTLTAVFRYSF